MRLTRWLLVLISCVGLIAAGASPVAAFTLTDNATTLDVNETLLDEGIVDALWTVNGVDIGLQSLGFMAPNGRTLRLGNRNPRDRANDRARVHIGWAPGPGLRRAHVSMALRGSFADATRAEVWETIEVSNRTSSTITFFHHFDFFDSGTLEEVDANHWRYTASAFTFEESVSATWDDLEVEATGYTLFWDVAPHSARVIEKSKSVHLVPEASTSTLISLGLACLFWTGRQSRSA